MKNTNREVLEPNEKGSILLQESKSRYRNLDSQIKNNDDIIKQKLEKKGMSEGMKSNMFSDSNTNTTHQATTGMSFNRKGAESKITDSHKYWRNNSQVQVKDFLRNI